MAEERVVANDLSDEGDDESLLLGDNQRIISLCYSKKILSFAIYDELESKILTDYIHSPIDDLEELIEQLKQAFPPSFFVLPPALLLHREIVDIIGRGPSGSASYYEFRTLRSSYWTNEMASEAIYNKLLVKEQASFPRSFVEDIPNNAHIGRLNISNIASKVDLENIQLRQALGGLINYMLINFISVQDGRVFIGQIDRFQLGDYMKIDECSLRYLLKTNSLVILPFITHVIFILLKISSDIYSRNASQCDSKLRSHQRRVFII